MTEYVCGCVGLGLSCITVFYCLAEGKKKFILLTTVPTSFYLKKTSKYVHK